MAKKKQQQVHTEKRQLQLRQFLVDWIIDDCQPIHVVTNIGLKHFLNELDPAFSMPCEETVKNIIYSAYNYSFPQLKQLIQIQATSISLTMDLWTARNRQGYLGVTCSYFDQSFQLKEFALDVAYVRYPHTAENILNTLEEILMDWEIRNLIFNVTTDNASNMKKAVKIMDGVNWLGCTAHTLQLVIGKGMKPAEILIARVKRLIDFFLRPKQSERLEEIQERFPELANELKNKETDKKNDSDYNDNYNDNENDDKSDSEEESENNSENEKDEDENEENEEDEEDDDDEDDIVSILFNIFF
jgi:hypothetical protein